MNLVDEVTVKNLFEEVSKGTVLTFKSIILKRVASSVSKKLSKQKKGNDYLVTVDEFVLFLTEIGFQVSDRFSRISRANYFKKINSYNDEIKAPKNKIYTKALYSFNGNPINYDRSIKGGVVHNPIASDKSNIPSIFFSRNADDKAARKKNKKEKKKREQVQRAKEVKIKSTFGHLSTIYGYIKNKKGVELLLIDSDEFYKKFGIMGTKPYICVFPETIRGGVAVDSSTMFSSFVKPLNNDQVIAESLIEPTSKKIIELKYQDYNFVLVLELLVKKDHNFLTYLELTTKNPNDARRQDFQFCINSGSSLLNLKNKKFKTVDDRNMFNSHRLKMSYKKSTAYRSGKPIDFDNDDLDE